MGGGAMPKKRLSRGAIPPKKKTEKEWGVTRNILVKLLNSTMF